ncbi:MAG: hypothetical protein ABIY55_36365 [Kofleriaceae bacterium]
MVVAAVGTANAEPKKESAPFTADEMEHLAVTTKPGHEVEVRTGLFLTFHHLQASAKLKVGWHRAVSAGGAFSVEIPVKFNDLMMRMAATDGVEIRVDVLGGPVGTVKWTTSCARPKDSTRGPKYVKIEDKTERIGDRAWARRMELGPRICSLTVETTGTDPLPPEADVKRFFNSIKSTSEPTW